MTQDEIIELARQAAAQITIQANGDVFYSFYGIELEAFVKLVAEEEREALTPRCWTAEMNDAWNKAIPDLTLAFDELIRSRGEMK